MTDVKHRYWHRQIDGLVREISKLSIACNVKLLEPGNIERVLRNDETVCGRKNSRAFKQMRNHLMAFFQIQERAIERIGPEDVRSMLDTLRQEMQNLRGRTDSES